MEIHLRIQRIHRNSVLDLRETRFKKAIQSTPYRIDRYALKSYFSRFHSSVQVPIFLDSLAHPAMVKIGKTTKNLWRGTVNTAADDANDADSVGNKRRARGLPEINQSRYDVCR